MLYLPLYESFSMQMTSSVSRAEYSITFNLCLLLIFIVILKILAYLFWLHQVLVVVLVIFIEAHGIFHRGAQASL